MLQRKRCCTAKVVYELVSDKDQVLGRAVIKDPPPGHCEGLTSATVEWSQTEGDGRGLPVSSKLAPLACYDW